MERATFAGGCFWCTEAVFKNLKGVSSVVSGYAGGTVSEPTYDLVSSGRSGHAEAIQVTFDPSVVSYEQLVEVFFGTHDPTTTNQQGADVGTQYRSVIFVENEAQRRSAEHIKAELTANAVFPQPIVTTIESLGTFYRAEGYHQNYYDRNPENPYCQAVISPKLAKLRATFAPLLKS